MLSYQARRAKYGGIVQANIWPETIALMKRKANARYPTRAALGRLSIQSFRAESLVGQETDIVELPTLEMVQARYRRPLTVAPINKLPLLSISLERGSDIEAWLEHLVRANLAASNADAIRRVVAYEMPVLKVN